LRYWRETKIENQNLTAEARRRGEDQRLESGKIIHHIWTEEEVENLRQLLPKIANGRKTRYKKKQSAKTKKKTQARAPAVHKSFSKQKKK